MNVFLANSSLGCSFLWCIHYKHKSCFLTSWMKLCVSVKRVQRLSGFEICPCTVFLWVSRAVIWRYPAVLLIMGTSHQVCSITTLSSFTATQKSVLFRESVRQSRVVLLCVQRFLWWHFRPVHRLNVFTWVLTRDRFHIQRWASSPNRAANELAIVCRFTVQNNKKCLRTSRFEGKHKQMKWVLYCCGNTPL